VQKTKRVELGKEGVPRSEFWGKVIEPSIQIQLMGITNLREKEKK